VVIIKTIMKRTLLTLLLFATFSLSSCLDSRPVLRVYNWDDYLNPDLVPLFEKEANCKVELLYFESNEQMRDAVASGEGGPFDVLVPSSYMAEELYREKLIMDLDHSQLPNLDHIDAKYLSDLATDKDMKYTVPYMMGFTGLAFTAGIVDEDAHPSWRLLTRADLKGRTILLDDMRETIGAALKSLGYSLNSSDPTELEEASAVLKEWAANSKGFDSSVYDDQLVQRDVRLAMAYSGDVLADEEALVHFVAPREGMSLFCDGLAIAADSPNPELAHKFINFVHDPKICAQNAEYIMYRAPNSSAEKLLPADIREHPAIYPDEAVLAKCEIIAELDEETTALYEKIWKEIRGEE
ncbi:MAG: spermidine/putrescine ABC transporter substrate-binding protein, partial [Verrucomicrobiota bacterium]